MKDEHFEQQVGPQAPAQHDNLPHRALFSLPPIQVSASTDLAVLEMPAQKAVTGDVEIDAVLWLREVISTGQADLIAKAKEAVTRIRTPLKQLEKRYTDWIHRTSPGNFGAVLSAFDFADLDGLATRAAERARRTHEAHARFGDSLFDDTPAEQFCNETLACVTTEGEELDAADVDMLFDVHCDQRPTTLADCLHELTYWHELYWMRDAVGDTGAGDESEQVQAREDYVFRCLARISPRDADEAAAVLTYLVESERMDRAHTTAILFNLIGKPKPYNPKEGDRDA